MANHTAPPVDALPVRHLFSIALETGEAVDVPDAPQGRRMIVGISGGSFEGERLRGRVVGAGGDWLHVRANGSMRLDVRMNLETDDGAHIYVSYNGLVTPDGNGTKSRSAPLFETGDERYTWLNEIQAVGIGGIDGTTVRYQVYELL